MKAAGGVFSLLVAPVALAALGCYGLAKKPAELRGVRAVNAAVAFELIRDSPDVVVLDLREPEEYGGAAGHLPGAINMPLADLPRRLEELRPLTKTAFLIYCRSGSCGLEGVEILTAAGFRFPLLVDGGIEAWLGAGFRTVDLEGQTVGAPRRSPEDEPRRGPGVRRGGGSGGR